MAARRSFRTLARLGVTGPDDCRGYRRPDRGPGRRLHRADRLGVRQWQGGTGKRDRGVALHRLTGAIADRGAARAARCRRELLLAPGIAIEAIRDMAVHHPASTSPVGMAVAASSLVIMPVLGVAKKTISRPSFPGRWSPLTESNRRPSPYHGHRGRHWPGVLPGEYPVQLLICASMCLSVSAGVRQMAPLNGSPEWPLPVS